MSRYLQHAFLLFIYLFIRPCLTPSKSEGHPKTLLVHTKQVAFRTLKLKFLLICYGRFSILKECLHGHMHSVIFSLHQFYHFCQSLEQLLCSKLLPYSALASGNIMVMFSMKEQLSFFFS